MSAPEDRAAQRGAECRRLLRARRHGVLATHSQRHQGYPFGSVLPFLLDHAGRPLLLVSALAEHTRNIAADARVSLLVHEPGPDVQARSRVTLLGEARRVEVDAAERARYLRYFPEAESHLALDFSFHRIEPRVVRFIGGFGDIHWVSREAYLAGDGLAAIEAGAIEHMNADHAEALRDYARHLHAREARHVTLAGVDCDGFDLLADDMLLRCEFPAPVTDAAGLRATLAAMAAAARSDGTSR